MKTSFFINPGDLHTNGGYGLAGYNIVTSMQKIGLTVPFDDSTAPVQLNFSFPSVFADSLRPNQYSIWLAVWESTLLQSDWHDIIPEVDEIWTCSPWVKNIIEENGYDVKQIYPHGIDPMWLPKRRNRGNVLRFLHDGEPAPRKGGQLAFDAFKAAFGTNNDVQLIIKSKGHSTIRERRNGIYMGEPSGNVKVITQTMDLPDLVGLYHASHVMVCPSYGEGFGFPALQGLATGMPTICTKEWAHYADHLGDLGLKSTYGDSPWPEMHPGKVCFPDFDDLVDKYRYVYDNYDRLAGESYRRAHVIHGEYDWLTLTEKAFKDVKKQFFQA